MTNRFLEKAAELQKLAAEKPKEHQQRVLDKLRLDKPDEESNIIAAHSMGSGKTLTALLAAKEAQRHSQDHVTMVVPASLVDNVSQEAKKHGISLDESRFHVTSYDKAVNDKELHKRKHSLVILDEAHKIRNKDTERSRSLKSILRDSKKTLLLTGTPSYNKPHDVAVLLNHASGRKLLPDTEKDFNARYIGTRTIDPGYFAKKVLGTTEGESRYLKNQKELRKILKKHIDTYDAAHSAAEDFPTVSHKVVEVSMSPEQEKVYDYLEGRMPRALRWKIRLGLPLDKKESSNLNAFSTGVRQASNSVAPYSTHKSAPSNKHIAMANAVANRYRGDPNYRGFSYSNYLESGLRPLSEQLHVRGVPHAIYDGSLSQKEKSELIRKYNDGELRHLLISSSGSEGLNLKGTKYEQVMEPHFNDKKIDQIVARGVRFKSHSHLPPEERHVSVEHFHSIRNPSVLDKMMGQKIKTIDQYLHQNSKEKSEIQDQIMDMVKST